MRHLTKLFRFATVSQKPAPSLFPIFTPRPPLRLLLSRFKSSTANKKHSLPKSRHHRRTPPAKPPRAVRAAATPSLLQEITGLVGVDPGSAKSEGANFGGGTARRNARHGRSGIAASSEEPTSETLLPVEEMGGDDLKEVGDVSPIVHKITEMVRANESGVGMEEMLGRSGVVLNEDIVEKVLKRCFKVGHLARKFFGWARSQRGFSHTAGTYNVMLYIAGEAKDLDLVEELVCQMNEDSCPKDIKTWTILVSHYGNVMRIGKALKAFRDMRKSGCQPDKKIFEAVIHALCKCKKPELAMEFYSDMRKQFAELSFFLYEKLMCCLSGSGDIAGVRKIGDDMKITTDVNEVYSCIMRSFCSSGRINEAWELIDEMKDKNFAVDSDTLRLLLKALCQKSRVEEAREVLDYLKKHNICPDKKDYGLIIYGYLRRGDTVKAFQVLSDMETIGCTPTVTTYTQLIHHLNNSEDYTRACELYAEMLRNKIEPDIMANTAILIGHVRNGNISEAWKVIEKIKKDGVIPLNKVYSVFIKELCKASKPDEALKVLIQMSESSDNISHKTYNLVMSSLRLKGYLEKVRMMEKMYKLDKVHCKDAETSSQPLLLHALHKEPNISSCSFQQERSFNDTSKIYNYDNLKEICTILFSSTDWMSMQEEFKMRKICFTPELVVKILHHCRMHGNIALNFFSWAGKVPGYDHTTETYNMAIKIAGGAKDFKHMRNLFSEMRRKRISITPDTWTIMICQYGQAGLTEMALKKFKEMKIDGHHPNRSTFKFLIIFLCGKKGRKVDEAIKVHREMILAGHVADKEMVEIYLSCLCESQRLLEAKKCVDLLSKNGFPVQESHALLIRSLCRANKLEEALAFTDEMSSIGCTVNEYIYGSLIHALLRAGRFNDAMDKVEEMKKDGISQTVHIYTSLIIHYFKEKQVGRAIDMFKRMREDGCVPTIVTCSAVIRGYMSAGLISDAWDVFQKMQTEGPLPDFQAYSMFITCLCKAGRSEEGKLLLTEMLSKEILPSAINFRTVFYGLNREGKQDLAYSVLHEKWSLSRKRKFLA